MTVVLPPGHHRARRGSPTRSDIWSPYYRISILHRGVTGAIEAINVNGIPHQGLHCVECRKEPFYDQVYKWFPDRTLRERAHRGRRQRLGRGAALRATTRDIKHIDAVEIDPRIQDIGIERPPRPAL